MLQMVSPSPTVIHGVRSSLTVRTDLMEGEAVPGPSRVVERSTEQVLTLVNNPPVEDIDIEKRKEVLEKAWIPDQDKIILKPWPGNYNFMVI